MSQNYKNVFPVLNVIKDEEKGSIVRKAGIRLKDFIKN
jgi:hypothetical protein